MPYDDIKKVSGRIPVTILEIDLSVCKHTFATSPCTATLAGPGLQCYNTRGTCQDTPNFDRDDPADPVDGTTKTYRFSNIRLDDLQAAGESPTFPTLRSVSTSPTKLTPGEGFGIRSTLKVALDDHPYTDVGVDPYRSARGIDYNDGEHGTFWGRMIARNEFYENRECRLLQGYLDENGNYDATNMKTRYYLLFRLTGPDKKGQVMIEAKDPLKAADALAAQWPMATSAELTSDINDTVTSISVTDLNGDIDDAYTNGQKYIRIDDEVMLQTSAPTGGPSSWTLTVTRATLPSIYTKAPTAEDHDAGATVQPCYWFNAVRIDSVLYTLLNEAAGIAAAYLPLSTQWSEVINFGMTNYTLSRLIIEPTSVKDMIQELTQHTMMVWWDEREQIVKISSILYKSYAAGPYTEGEHIEKDSVSVTKDVKNRNSQVWVAYGVRSPLEDQDKIQTYQRVEISANLNSQSEEQYGRAAVKRIFSPWMPLSLSSVANEISSRLLSEYEEVRNLVQCTMDPKDDAQWTGDGLRLTTDQIIDEFGEPKELPYLVLQVDEILKPNGTKYKYLLQELDGLFRFGNITETYDPPPPTNPFPSYADSSDAYRAVNMYICADDGKMPSDGSDGYVIR